MSNPNQATSTDEVLRQESLKLKWVINLARGAPLKDWPPPDTYWNGIFLDLKDATGRGELPARVHHTKERFSTVRLDDLWPFVKNRDDRWQPLRDFCQRWFTARGEEPPVSITPDGPNPTAAPGVDPYQTGLSGRPKIGHLILVEFRKRVEQSTFHLTLAEEAKELCKWAKREHPGAPPVKAPSIENLIRVEHRRAMAATP